jgi:hypothetical protein
MILLGDAVIKQAKQMRNNVGYIFNKDSTLGTMFGILELVLLFLSLLAFGQLTLLPGNIRNLALILTLFPKLYFIQLQFSLSMPSLTMWKL